jgi:hypothetical protein
LLNEETVHPIDRPERFEGFLAGQGNIVMSKFITPLRASLRDDSDEIYVLEAPLTYHSDLIGLISVPAGFQTDLASVPRLPFIYQFLGGRAHREAVLHDYLYRIDAQRITRDIDTITIDTEGREIYPSVTLMQANNVFLEAMKVRNKPPYVYYPFYWGVCVGGWVSYHKRYVNDVL